MIRLLFALIVAFGSHANAATITATPATISADLARAQPGDTVQLGAGNYGTLSLKARTGLSIDATAAQLAGAFITGSTGITIKGGRFVGTGGHGVDVQLSRNVTLAGGVYSGFAHGIVIDRSQDVQVTRNSFTALTEDAVDVALSQRVLVEGNVGWGFVTTPLKHADFIQGWSRPGGITSDVTIRGNVAASDSQGVSFFDHVRNGVPDGGFDRITITGNTLRTGYGQAIAVMNCRECEISSNDVAGLPGSSAIGTINVTASTGRFCGNAVEQVKSVARKECAK